MGMRFDGPICASCKTLIEGGDFITCNACQSVIHRNEHCERIHKMSCSGNTFKRQNIPDRGIRPDPKDIFK